MLMSILPPRRSTLRHAAVLCIGALAAIAHAQSTAVIPPAAETAVGVSVADSRPLGDAVPSVYQVIYDASLLASIPRGSVITGLQVRSNNIAVAIPSWPAAPLTIDRYDITMGSSDRTPATKSATFADNLRNPVLVRSGPLSLAAGAYPGGPLGSPKPFGPLIPFTTGFVYSGGPLVILLRVSNASGANENFADVIESPDMGEITNGSSADAAVGDELYSGSGLVVRLTFTPPPTDLAKGVTKVMVGDDFVATNSDLGTASLISSNATTTVEVASADQFDTIGPGSDFVGVARRLDGVGMLWPGVPASFLNYDVQLARSLTLPGSLSSVIASNIGADVVTTRSGPLTIPVGALGPRGLQQTAPFSWEIPFDTPYVYTNGPLLSVVRHTGQASGGIEFLNAITGSESRFQAAAGTGYTPSNAADPLAVTIARYSVDAGTSSPLGQLTPLPGGIQTPLPRRTQVVLSASELRYVPVGSVIDSLWLRQFAGALAATPGADVSALDCEITLSTATAQPEFMSSAFSDNQGSDRVLVHDGPLAILAGTLPPGTKGTFGKFAQFQRQFVYKGGPLCIDIRYASANFLLDNLEPTKNTSTTNRAIYNFDPNNPVGLFLGAGYNGLAVKLGYIPSVISPNSLATGVSGADWSATFESDYSFQLLIPASQLLTVDHGSAITGMSFRRASSQSGETNLFPAADTTVPRFDVSISGANTTPLTMSTTYANNVGMDEVLARSGPLTIPANAFPASGLPGSPNDNAWYINFDRGYVYQGGDLCLTVRGQGVISTAGYLEGSTFSPSTDGAAVYNYGNADAANGFFYGPLAVRFAFTPRAFCPADLNNDGVVDDSDFQIFVLAYDILDCNDPTMPAACPSDLSFDRIVEDLDFQVFVLAYNEVLCP